MEEAAERIAGLNPEGIGCVAYEPDSGYANADALVAALVERARRNGAEAHSETPARGINFKHGRVVSVIADQAEISTPVAVNAAGPWASVVGRWAGIELPLEISREQDVIIRPPAGMPRLRHSVSNMVDRTYMRPEGDGLILAGTGHPKENEPADPDSYKRQADGTFIEDVSRRLAHRLPALARGSYVAGWAGLYTITPDWNMIVDKAPGLEGFFLAVGGSGHSFKLAPAIGLCLAELIVDGRASTVDITPLRATRFDENDPLRSTYGGNRG